MIIEIIILILIIVLLLLNIFLVVKLSSAKRDEKDTIERLGRFEFNISKSINDFKNDFNKSLTGDFEKLTEKIDMRLTQINDRVSMRLDENFEKTNKTFGNILQRLTRIDEAQKQIETLSHDIVSLQSILTDKKSRGIFGEVNLTHILSSVFGEKNDKVYQLQYQFKNRVMVDAILFAPDPLGTVGIDSKFPLENYRLMVDRSLSAEERIKHEKSFKSDIKKHIDAIADKYIIPGETSDQAIMFLPAEAIFAELSAYHQDLIDYSYKRRVWITSPTTLISTLTVIQMILKNMERDKYTSIIHEELNKLGVEFKRYRERWDHLAKSIQTVNKDVENVHITTEKISKKFESISQVEIEVENLEEENTLIEGLKTDD